MGEIKNIVSSKENEYSWNRAVDGGFRTPFGGMRVFVGGSVASAAAAAEFPILAPQAGSLIVFGASEVVAGADDIQVGVQDVYYGLTRQNGKESKSFLKDEIMGGNQEFYENFHVGSSMGMHISSPNIAVIQKSQKPPT